MHESSRILSILHCVPNKCANRQNGGASACQAIDVPLFYIMHFGLWKSMEAVQQPSETETLKIWGEEKVVRCVCKDHLN